MTTAEKLERDGLADDAILEHYRNAAKALYELVRDADPSLPFARYRRQQLGAILKILRQLDRNAQRWIQRHIPKLMEDAHRETLEKIKSFQESEFSLRFSGVDREAVKVMTSEVGLAFGNTITGLKRSGEKKLLEKRVLHGILTQGVIRGSSPYRTQKELLDALRAANLEVLQGRNGRKWSLENYTNMLVRSQTLTAYNTAAANTMLKAGRRFAKIPKLRPDIDGPDICNRWEEAVYIDLKKPEQVPPWHPNCFLPGTKITGNVIRASKARYSGEAITIHSAKGHRLSVTPNHPILTPRGFVPAASLQAGDQVVSYNAEIQAALPVMISEQRNDYEGPALVEDVFEAIKLRGFLASTRPSALDFHGDAQPWNGDIDIVEMDWIKILNADDSAIADHFSEGSLIAGDTNSFTPDRLGMLDLGVDGRPSASGGGPGIAELPLQVRPITPLSSPLQPLSFGGRAFLDTVFSQYPLDDVLTDAVLALHLHDRHPASILFDEVVEVRRFPFDGHVYNVESTTGWIVADGVCTSNCRHVPQAVSFAELKANRPDLYRLAVAHFEAT